MAKLTSDEKPGWYAHPPGTIANQVTADDLRAAGVAS